MRRAHLCDWDFESRTTHFCEVEREVNHKISKDCVGLFHRFFFKTLYGGEVYLQPVQLKRNHLAGCSTLQNALRCDDSTGSEIRKLRRVTLYRRVFHRELTLDRKLYCHVSSLYLVYTFNMLFHGRFGGRFARFKQALPSV